MDLSITPINLMGYFVSSIDGLTIFGDGGNRIADRSLDGQVEAYEMSVYDKESKTLSDSFLIAFKQEGDKLMCGYKDRLFVVFDVANSYIQLVDEFGICTISRFDLDALGF
jgi:hypothetical protein